MTTGSGGMARPHQIIPELNAEAARKKAEAEQSLAAVMNKTCQKEICGGEDAIYVTGRGPLVYSLVQVTIVGDSGALILIVSRAPN